MPIWLIFALGTVFCWGAYGTAIHKSNVLLGHGMKTLLLVGVAYFFLAVLIPGIYIMSKQAIDWSFPTKGLMFGLLAGSLGALGAICVTFAMRPESGGNPLFVMPIRRKILPASSASWESSSSPRAQGWSSSSNRDNPRLSVLQRLVMT